MDSVIQTIVKRLWGSKKDEFRVVILGLDAAGKTTMLYKLLLGENITAIPTIGFNLESLDIKNRFGNITIMGWDLGGCDKIRPLFRHYFPNSNGCIYVADSNDRERVYEAAVEFGRFMLDLAAEHGSLVPCVFLCNKQDLPGAMSVAEIRNHFASKVPRGMPIAFFPVVCTAPIPDSGLPEAFEWFTAQLLGLQAIGQESKPKEKIKSNKLEEPLPPVGSLSQRFETYLSRALDDTAPEQFMEQFKAYDLPSWDHYTHIRFAFIILTQHGRQKGKDMIFDGIKDYIANSTRTNGRTFHLTMTYFWIQMVHFGIRSVPASQSQPLTSSNDDFLKFLTVNPFVVDGNLWADYYSKNIIMTPEAKDSVVLPDKNPLPNLIARESVKSWVNASVP